MNIITHPITGDRIRIAKKDFPNRISWEEANNMCVNLGNGWRLPTEIELNEMYTYKNEIGRFTEFYYWSSTSPNQDNIIDYLNTINPENLRWAQLFENGDAEHFPKFLQFNVRAVQDLNNLSPTHSEHIELKIKDTFDKNFYELISFLNQYNRFPEKVENSRIYIWMLSLQAKHKRKILDQKYVDQLDSIGFIWSKRELNWFRRAKVVKKMLVEQKLFPFHSSDKLLYHWLEDNLKLFYKNILQGDQKLLFSEIIQLIKKIQNSTDNEPVVKISARELTWTQKLNDLILYRKRNPNAWPQVESADQKEKKLGIWCQDLRHRFRNKLLDEPWFSKLEAIGFNFEGKHDKWKERFNQLKTYLQENNKAPDSRHTLYTWARLQYKNLDELTYEKRELLHSIDFFKYFEKETWDKKYSELQTFISLNKKVPTKKYNKDLYHWLSVQRTQFKKGNLNDKKISLLKNLGVDLSPNVGKEDIWNSKYEALIKFREENPDRWPSSYSEGTEKKLYLWCQAQRQVNAKTATGRKELSKVRIDKLNKIGFQWSKKEINDKNWEDNWHKLKKYIIENGGISNLPVAINGKQNNLYAWLRYQKMAIQKGTLSVDKIERLQSLGIKG